MCSKAFKKIKKFSSLHFVQPQNSVLIASSDKGISSLVNPESKNFFYKIKTHKIIASAAYCSYKFSRKNIGRDYRFELDLNFKTREV